MTDILQYLGKNIVIVVNDHEVQAIQSGKIIAINTNDDEIIIETNIFNGNFGLPPNKLVQSKFYNATNKLEDHIITPDFLYWGTNHDTILGALEYDSAIIF